jgi:hypothetical protein
LDRITGFTGILDIDFHRISFCFFPISSVLKRKRGFEGILAHRGAQGRAFLCHGRAGARIFEPPARSDDQPARIFVPGILPQRTQRKRERNKNIRM